MRKIAAVIILFLLTFSTIAAQTLKISPNRRFFTKSNGKPFFWLGDTGWLLFKKCSREETIKYLDTRQ